MGSIVKFSEMKRRSQFSRSFPLSNEKNILKYRDDLTDNQIISKPIRCQPGTPTANFTKATLIQITIRSYFQEASFI